MTNNGQQRDGVRSTEKVQPLKLGAKIDLRIQIAGVETTGDSNEGDKRALGGAEQLMEKMSPFIVLGRGVKVWNRWRLDHPGETPSFDGRCLMGVELAKVDLHDAHLTMTNFCIADLREADLRGAHLREAILCRTDLRRADLRGADLSRAFLYGADLRGADLRGGRFFGATLNEADLRGALYRKDQFKWATYNNALSDESGG